MAGAATLIRWSGVGGCLHGVKIELYHRGFRLLAIENRTRVAAGTAHVWRVPWTLLVATSSERDYVVVVSSHDYDRAGGTGARGSSSPFRVVPATFVIRSPPPTPTSSSSGSISSVRAGAVLSVEWDLGEAVAAGSDLGPAQVELYRNDRWVLSISDSAAAGGEAKDVTSPLPWVVPVGLETDNTLCA